VVDFQLAGKRIAVAGPRGMVGSALLRRLARVDCELLPLGRADNLAGSTAGFADAAGGNLHLTPTSAAIGRGDAAQASAEDINADARPRKGAVDAGAYQFSR